MADEKKWGGEPFWGLGYEWDPDWVLTERQKELRDKLIELCEQEMRANAKRSDDELLYPRRNLELLGEHGFLALTVPEEYGGLGENHVAFAMVCETIARYGCASTAMCYVMHIGAVHDDHAAPDRRADRQVHPAAQQRQDRHPLLLGPRDRLALLVSDLLRRRALERRLQGAQEGVVDDLGRLRRLLRRADDEPGLHRLRRPLGLRHRRRDVKAQPSLWDALGLRGNQSGPIEVDGRRDPRRAARRPGRRRRGVQRRGGRPVVPGRLLVGVERHRDGRDRHRQAPHDPQAPRRRRHARRRLPDDPGLRRRGGDGHERLPRCSCCRSRRRWTARPTTTRAMLEPGETARADYLHWAWQIKFEAAKNIAHVVDKMLHACGGSGYKRDMELERYLRDAKAGWVMGPTNEVLRQFVGKAVLLGFDALDYWNQTYNRRAVENEVKKLDPDGKRELAEQLSQQAEEEEAKAPASLSAWPSPRSPLPRASSRSTRAGSSTGCAGRRHGRAVGRTTRSRCAIPTAASPPSSRCSTPRARGPGALGVAADAPASVLRASRPGAATASSPCTARAGPATRGRRLFGPGCPRGARSLSRRARAILVVGGARRARRRRRRAPVRARGRGRRAAPRRGSEGAAAAAGRAGLDFRVDRRPR